MKSIFRKKSLNDILENSQKKQLKKNLSVVDLVLIGIGTTIGTGIFVLTGTAAANYAGPAISISYLICGFICMFAGLAYAELASTIPISGSAYTYSYVSMGEIVAWLVGWGLILEYTVASSTVAAGWSAYFTGVMNQAGYHIPEYLTTTPSNGGIINLPAFCISILIGMILVRGTKESAIFNRILVTLKLGIIFLFLYIATPYVKVENYSEFMPFGWKGVLLGASAVFFAYLGFDSVATTAEECKNPKRDLPIGIIGSLLICTVLYILVCLALTGIVNFRELNNSEPMAHALRVNGSNLGSALIGTGAIAGMLTVLLVMMYGQSRIFFAMSRDGLIPAFFSKLHKKFTTPYINCILLTLVVATISGFTPIRTLGDMSSLGTLFAFCLASVGVMVLRITQPNLKRSFRCPAVFVVAPIAIIGCGYLMISLLRENGTAFFTWFALGIVFYFAYSYKNSSINSNKK